MSLIFFSTIIFFIICFTLLKQNYLIIKICFVLNYLVYIISYLLTIVINPGIPERKYFSENMKNKNKIMNQKEFTICEKCNIIIPKEINISHCIDCDICVIEQDHHCPWTGKCIAKYNLKYFYVFVNSLLIYFINIFVTLYSSMFYQTKNRKKI